MKYLLCIIAVIGLWACNKEDFLNQKPNQSNVVPTTLKDLRAILDSDDDLNGMGGAGRGPVPNLGEIGSDAYYLPDEAFNNLREEYKNLYIWADDPYVEPELYSWKWPYKTIFLTNIVLDELSKMNTFQDQEAYNSVLGDALFYRAHTFYQLAQVFAPHYQKESAHIDKGIPLRLTADVSEKIQETTVEETYKRIIQDLENAAGLLSEIVPVKTRPTKQAAYALLARVFVNMKDYEAALTYADSCLQIQSELLDYNSLEVDSSFPFLKLNQNNPEIIFSCNMSGPDYFNYPIRPQIARVAPSLTVLYRDADLRKRFFFKEEENGLHFKGSYNGSDEFFAGLATDEVILIRAECNARLGKLEESIGGLNRLMRNRWSHDVEYIPLVASSQEEVLNAIFLERRKELLFRGLRWVDLRRLNSEGKGENLTRVVNGEVYTLSPGDLNYTWPLPKDVLSFRK